VVEDVPDVEVYGKPPATCCWSPGAALRLGARAAEQLQGREERLPVHLRWLNPLPKNLGSVLKKFKKVMVPEVNNGQLASTCAACSRHRPGPVQRINGKPIKIAELAGKVLESSKDSGKDTHTWLPRTGAAVYSKKDFESGVDPAGARLRRLLHHQPGAEGAAGRRPQA